MIYLHAEGTIGFSDPAVRNLKREEQIAAIPFGVAATLSDSGDFTVWYPHETPWLIEYLLDGQLVVGFGSYRYDLPLIWKAAEMYARAGHPIPSVREVMLIDLLSEMESVCGRMVSLYDLYRATTGLEDEMLKNAIRGFPNAALARKTARWMPNARDVLTMHLLATTTALYRLYGIMGEGLPLEVPPNPSSDGGLSPVFMYRQDNVAGWPTFYKDEIPMEER